MYLSGLIQNVPVIRKKVITTKPKQVSTVYSMTEVKGGKKVCV